MSHFKKLLRSTKICSKCGARIFTQGFDETHRLSHIMKRLGVCYDCAFWEDFINYPPLHTEVLGSVCLKVYPGVTKKGVGVLLGGKGKIRYFVRPDMTVLCSNDIWNIGDVPERYREQLPPTLTEITLKAYKNLKKTNKRCQARACLDRYNCFRYNLELEKETSAYNVVPKNWKVGDEHCGFRIDFKEILTDDSSGQ